MKEYLWVVQFDLPTELEDECNRIYDTQHIPNILRVSGVLGVQRYRPTLQAEGVSQYMAMYRVTSPDLPFTPDWLAASGAGDWPVRIRPHVLNLRRVMYEAPGCLPVVALRKPGLS